MTKGELIDKLGIDARRAVETWLRTGEWTPVSFSTAEEMHEHCVPLALALAAVNAALWERESLVRAAIAAASPDNPADDKKIADLARAICKLNDERRRLIRQIDGGAGEEKVYL